MGAGDTAPRQTAVNFRNPCFLDKTPYPVWSLAMVPGGSCLPVSAIYLPFLLAPSPSWAEACPPKGHRLALGGQSLERSCNALIAS